MNIEKNIKYGIEDPFTEFDTMDKDIRKMLLAWIDKTYMEGQRTLKRSSYGIKHDFERDSHEYVTNGQFKGAMKHLGFEPINPEERNWIFRMKRKPVLSFYNWLSEENGWVKDDCPNLFSFLTAVGGKTLPLKTPKGFAVLLIKNHASDEMLEELNIASRLYEDYLFR